MKFKIGDRVRVTDEYKMSRKEFKNLNSDGFVKGFHNEGYVGVEFLEPFKYGHDFHQSNSQNCGLAKGKDGYCRFFLEYEIELCLNEIRLRKLNEM